MTEHYIREAKGFFDPSGNPIETRKDYIKAFLRFEQKYLEKYSMLAGHMNLINSFHERLEMVNKMLFKFPNLNSEFDEDKKFQETWKWIEETKRYPCKRNDSPIMTVYEMCLRADLKSGTDDFGKKNPPYALTEEELDIYMPILLEKIKNL